MYSPNMSCKMLASSEDLVAFSITSTPEHLSSRDTNGNDRDAVRGKVLTCRSTVATWRW